MPALGKLPLGTWESGIGDPHKEGPGVHRTRPLFVVSDVDSGQVSNSPDFTPLTKEPQAVLSNSSPPRVAVLGVTDTVLRAGGHGSDFDTVVSRAGVAGLTEQRYGLSWEL